MNFECLPEFNHDLKQLLKRYRSLKDDLRVLTKYLAISPSALPPTSFRVSNLRTRCEIVKVKKFACKSLKGKGARSGVRLVYAFHQAEQKIVFLEIYYKGDKANEDRGRILKYYG